jgi:hypothetical protein
MAKQTYVFNAKLDGWEDVRGTIAVRADQTLADLHDVLQAAFGWDNDHLYARSGWAESSGRETTASMSIRSRSMATPSPVRTCPSPGQGARAPSGDSTACD